jgi:hypothetical protein
VDSKHKPFQRRLVSNAEFLLGVKLIRAKFLLVNLPRPNWIMKQAIRTSCKMSSHQRSSTLVG